MAEILVVQKKKDKLKIKVESEKKRGYGGIYQKVIKNKDPNLIALLFLDLFQLGFPIEKAFWKFKEMIDKPDLFFLDK